MPDRVPRERVDWARRHAGSVVLTLAVNVILPALIYGLSSARAGERGALLASAAPPLLWSVVQCVRHRRVDALSVLVLAGIVLSLCAMGAGGSIRFVQLRENLVGALVGLAFLGSAAIGRPLIYQLARALLLRRSPDAAAAFEAKRDTPRFRRLMTTMTMVWGLGLVGGAVAASALASVLSVQAYVVAGPLLHYGVLAALAAWTVWVRRRARASAAEGAG